MPIERRPLTVTISVEAISLITAKAALHHLPPDRIVEWMVESFSQSSPEEVRASSKRRLLAKRAFFNDLPDPSAEAAWNNGFLDGWRQFQRRKASSPFGRVK